MSPANPLLDKALFPNHRFLYRCALWYKLSYKTSHDGRLVHLALTPQSITLQAVQPSPLSWGITGSLGLPRDVENLHWISLAQDGVKEADFNLREAKEPTASDHCR